MWSRRLLILSLALCLALPAFCGWDAFRGSSDGSSSGTAISAGTPDTAQPGTSSTGDSSATRETEGLLRSYEGSSEDYDAALDGVSASLEEMRQTKAVKEALAKVDELYASKAALEENYATLKGIMEEQERIIADEVGVHFGVGLSFGYRPDYELMPGIDLQMRSGSWIFRAGVNYSIELDDLRWDPTRIGYEVGVMYEF